MKNISLLIFILGYLFPSLVVAQNQAPINFSSQYLRKGDSNDIKLIVRNSSSNQTFYYCVGVQALADTGWVGLLADIDALGQNDFLALTQIKARERAIKTVSRRRIFLNYPRYAHKKIRFEIEYYEKQDFESKSKIIYLPPI
jgi:hypothetical protein